MKEGESRSIDDGLYAGVVGDNSLFPKGRDPKPAIAKKIEADKQTKAALFPAAEIIAKVLNIELDTMYDLRSFLAEMPEDKDPEGKLLREEVRLRDRHTKLILSLAKQLSAALKNGEARHED